MNYINVEPHPKVFDQLKNILKGITFVKHTKTKYTVPIIQISQNQSILRQFFSLQNSQNQSILRKKNSLQQPSIINIV